VNFKEIGWHGLDYIHMVHDKYVAGVGHSEHASEHSGLISFTAKKQSASQYGFFFTVRRGQKEKKIRY
jgi:hypothetical protein